MNALLFLEKLSKLEQSAADLYKWYAEIFDDIEQAKELFLSLHKQEIQHKNLIALQSRLVMSSSGNMPDIPVDPRDILELERKIDTHMQGGVFELQDAIDFAIELEATAVETHCRFMAMEEYPSMAELLKALVSGDEEHKAALDELARIAPSFSL